MGVSGETAHVWTVAMPRGAQDHIDTHPSMHSNMWTAHINFPVTDTGKQVRTIQYHSRKREN